MTFRNLSTLEADAEPGVYEIFTVQGKTYELRLSEAGVTTLVRSLEAGEPDDLTGLPEASILSVDYFSISVGEPARFALISPPPGVPAAVMTAPVSSITQVG